MWLVQVLLQCLVAKPMIGREQELCGRAACDVTGGSGPVQVGTNTCLCRC